MDLETLIYETKAGVGWITLNRPRRMNALNNQLLKDLERVTASVGDDPEVGAAVITGQSRFFSIGADLTDISRVKDPVEARAFCSYVHQVFNAVEDLPKPVIAAVSGLALGGGCELAMACDLRLAADNARFGQPEIKIGVIPGAGGTQRLPRLVGLGRAKEMLMLGEPIDAEEACRIGLVNRVVPAESLLDEAMAMAKQLMAMPPVALATTKNVVNTGMQMDLKSALRLEAAAFEMLFATEDQKEGVSAFLEKRQPVFKGK